MDKANKPINLGFFHQMDGTRTLLKCSKSNSVLVKNFSKDGWYVYSYDSAATKSSEDTPYTLYFNHPPLSGLKTYLSSYLFSGVGPKTVNHLSATYGMDIISYMLKGKVRSARELAIQEKTSVETITRNLPLAVLKPDQVEKLLKGQHMPDLSVAKLLNAPSLI